MPVPIPVHATPDSAVTSPTRTGSMARIAKDVIAEITVRPPLLLLLLMLLLLLPIPLAAVAGAGGVEAGTGGDAAVPIVEGADAGRAAISSIPAWAQAALETLRGVSPVFFFGALVVATFLPFPVGLFYLAAGVLYGVGPALFWIASSLATSNLILHTAARLFLRPILEPRVLRRGYRIPRFESGFDEILFITFIRLTPGIPYFLQNLILAVAQLDLIRFLVLSVAIQMIYVTGFVVLGRSALEGRLGWALGGLALLVAVSAVARIVVRRRRPGEPPI